MARPKQSGDDFPQSRLLGDGSPAVSSLSVQFAVHMLSMQSRGCWRKDKFWHRGLAGGDFLAILHPPPPESLPVLQYFGGMSTATCCDEVSP